MADPPAATSPPRSCFVRDEGLPLPAALVLLSPEADLTQSGDSFATNFGVDNVLTSSRTADRVYMPTATT